MDYKFLTSKFMPRTPRLGFTLIEILISVTISSILMAGVLLFVSSSLWSQNAIQKSIALRTKNIPFEEQLSFTLDHTVGIFDSGTFTPEYLTWMLLKSDAADATTVLIGLKTMTGYCDQYKESANATGSVFLLAIKKLTVPSLQTVAPYILSDTDAFSGSERIIGTGYPGSTLGATGLSTELHLPSALIASGNYLYIADTMNDRILTYDLVSKAVSELLGRRDGIRKPTSLYLSGNTLLIANAWRGEILGLKDSEDEGTIFSGSFRSTKDFQADSIQISFSGISSVTSPDDITAFGFDSLTKDSLDTVSTWSVLQYHFQNMKSFSANAEYGLRVSGISPTPSIPGSYPARVDFYQGTILTYTEIFPYFTRWDGSLSTMMGNKMAVISENLNFPHSIIGPENWSSTMDRNVLLWNIGEEILSTLPVKNISFTLSGKTLTLKYEKYTRYDCLKEKHQTQEEIYKAHLP